MAVLVLEDVQHDLLGGMDFASVDVVIDAGVFSFNDGSRVLFTVK